MTFTGYSLSSVLTLLAAAGATLFVLHLLRSRPEPRRVVTTLFWTQARSAARPTFLWHRFRYLATFLLLLMIVSLLCLAISRSAWSWSALPAGHTVVVLDAGMSMQAKDASGRSRFQEAISTAEDMLQRAAPRDRLAIVIADACPRMVHGFDEPNAAARLSLSECAPASQPADHDTSMRLARSLLQGRSSPQIVRITDRSTPVKDDPNPAVPMRTIVVGQPAANAAILSVVFVPEPLRPSQGLLRIRIGWWAEQPASVPATIRINEQIMASTALQIAPHTDAEFVSPVMEAAGQIARITLELTDAVAGDNQMTVRLPRRPEIAVALDAAIPSAMRVAFEAASIRTLPLGSSGANLVVRGSDQPASDLPEMVLVRNGPLVKASPAVLVTRDAADSREISFEQAHAGEGSVIPAANSLPLITAGGQILAAMQDGPSAHKRLLLGSALLGPGSTVPNHPAFAQFMVQMLRELAGWDRPAMNISSRRTVDDAAWTAEMSLSAAGAVSPGDPVTSDTAQPRTPQSADASVDVIPAGHGQWSIAQLLLIAALLLMLVETGLHVRGRIV